MREWASNTNPSTGDYTAQNTKVEPTAGELADGLVPGESLKGQHLNWFLNTLSFASASLYGDGSDGDVTITGGTTTLTRDMYYANLTVESTGVLVTAGFRVFVSGVCEIEAGGVVHNDGNNGSIFVTTTGGAAGAAVASAAIGGSGAGGAGGNDSDPGTSAAAAANALGGSGGDGGTFGADAGGSGGVASVPAASAGGYRDLSAARGILLGTTSIRFIGGAGGGGGAGGTGVGGGGGGSGGGVVVIWAFELINNGTIRSAGGVGGNGAGGSNSGRGGPGGGGVVFTVARLRSGSGTITAPAGGAGSGGVAGTAASAGTVIALTA